MLDINRQTMELLLQSHGYTPEQLQALPTSEIKKAYEKITKQFLSAFLQNNSENKTNKISSSFLDSDEINTYKQKLKSCVKDVVALLQVLMEGYEKFDVVEVNDMLAIVAKNQSAHKMQRISHIAYHLLQEKLLSQIESYLKELPKQEFKMLKEHYERQREDLNALHKTIEKLADPLTKEQILSMARTKLFVMKEFMPELLNDTYKDYYNNTPEKLELVSKLMALTGLYTKEYLKETPLPKLQEMYDEILEYNRQEEQDKKMFLKYSSALQESIYSNDDEAFNEVCSRAVTHLSNKQLAMLVDYMSGQNPFFLSKFESVMNEYKKKLNIKKRG
ncbi:hypothetical protein CQA49_06335 [Helicobacter sp. MIT 00-7814]|uniref:hypothetical protein n=1 Tax=unclassified Helicobacter TaxID=2593540 RepID=UPI000E1F8511|nr:MULTISPECIES: hypothetical protein [unclassified Helicobacter]RDU53673.1 hypothetical protein CQA49_06335 [Helicobacter sp. MIT 00-7814]RDU54045.1 hypothetical protein CQA37_06300 [Helicobacter sp. MIT 99-10781]